MFYSIVYNFFTTKCSESRCENLDRFQYRFQPIKFMNSVVSILVRPSHIIINNYKKTGSLDNAIREFSLAKPSWYMSHYTMIYKNGERMRDFLGLFVFIVV